MVAGLADDLTASMYRHPDPETVREGGAAFLLLLDGLIESNPEDEGLLLAGARAYTAFASSFIDEDDRERGVVLHERGREYALRAFALRPGGEAALAGDQDEFEAYLGRFRAEDVPLLYGVAVAWMGWISAEGSPRARADFPMVRALLERCLALDETYDDGGVHLFFGIYYAVQPLGFGGDLEKSRSHFQRAMEINRGRNLMVPVLYARYYARMAFDRELFERTLREVLEAPEQDSLDYRLINALARRRAERLLAEIEEYF
jgi:hypothetical protein